MFGELVRQHRRRLGLTQQELADRAGLGVRSIRKIEAGQVHTPRPPTVRLLADTFRLAGVERDKFCEAAAQGTTDEPARIVIPAQLPPDVAWFTGRESHLAHLDTLFAGRERTPTAVVVSAVSGTAGVGKTALAVHWAHRVADRFPDGQLYVNLRGFDPGGRVMEPPEALRGFLDALGVPGERVPLEMGAQVGLYRSLLAGRRILIVLDNARDPEQVRPLLPGSGTPAVVVTSRDQLTGLVASDGAKPLVVDLLTVAEARELLARRLGSDRVAAAPDAVDQIIEACSRLPVALGIAAARAQQTGFPLEEIAGELDDARDRLDAFDAGNTTDELRAVFSWSYTALTPPAARLFRLLGLHFGPDISAPAAASLIVQPVVTTRRLLAELVRASMLAELRAGRFALHDLLRVYAIELVHRYDKGEQRLAATRRLLDHYLHTAHAADRLLHPRRDPIDLPLAGPAPGATPERLEDSRQAASWLTAEHPVLLAAFRSTAGNGSHHKAWQLVWILNTFLDRRGHWHSLNSAWRTVVDAADRVDTPAAHSYAYRQLARMEIRLGRYDDARAHLHRALDMAVQAGDSLRQAHTHSSLGCLLSRQGRPQEAFHHAYQALTLYQIVDHRRGQAIAHNNAGWYQTLLGNYARALAHCRQSLTLYRRLEDRPGEADVWDTLGQVHHYLGRHSRAVACYRRAIDMLHDVGDCYKEAETTFRLGDTHHAAGDVEAARTAWRRALERFTELAHHDADAVRARLEGIPG